MCTVTWRRDESSYEVFFNRDEKRDRPPARGPQIVKSGTHRFIAPIDGKAGGAWLAANEAGLTVGVLNYYDGQAGPPPAAPRSRGLLVLDQMRLATASAVRDALCGAALDCYPAFVLLAFDPREGWCIHWDGQVARATALDPSARPISTSSFDTVEVLRERRARYGKLVGGGEPSADALQRFHRDTIPRGGAYSVWMERPDAWTVSFSRVIVRPGEIQFLYQSRDDTAPVVVSLPLTA